MGSAVTTESFATLSEAELHDLAIVCERTKRYDDMCRFVQLMILKREEGGELELSGNERQLLAVAFKGAASRRRNTLSLLNEKPSEHFQLFAKNIISELIHVYKAISEISDKLIGATDDAAKRGFIKR